MQQTRSVELGTGLFVLLGLAALFFLTTQTTGSENFTSGDFYTVTARFENVGSLKDRAPVAMSGVTIGRVTDVKFDAESLDAVVTFVIDSQYSMIPDDSDASILTAGLLGSPPPGPLTGQFHRNAQQDLAVRHRQPQPPELQVGDPSHHLAVGVLVQAGGTVGGIGGHVAVQ